MRRILKQHIIEINYIPFASPVDPQRTYPWTVQFHLLLYLPRQYPPVPVPPAVNGLFYISHQDITVIFRKAVDDKGYEIFPLDPGGILKLIDHEMPVKITCFLIYEWRFIPADYSGKQGCHIG